MPALRIPEVTADDGLAAFSGTFSGSLDSETASVSGLQEDVPDGTEGADQETDGDHRGDPAMKWFMDDAKAKGLKMGAYRKEAGILLFYDWADIRDKEVTVGLGVGE